MVGYTSYRASVPGGDVDQVSDGADEGQVSKRLEVTPPYRQGY